MACYQQLRLADERPLVPNSPLLPAAIRHRPERQEEGLRGGGAAALYRHRPAHAAGDPALPTSTTR